MEETARLRSDRDAVVMAQAVLEGDRRALARAITLCESSRADHRVQALQVLELIAPRAGVSMRFGVSGPPGVGKSTFVEAVGLIAIENGHRVAVLAVDPSSAVSGGSILGDKTRMEALSHHPDAFIRPSPARRALGGVARRTHEVMLLCEAAGFDVVMIETVGVGQSESMVADMTDVLVLLLQPGSGDELQGIKRGLLELASIAVVNKADGELKAAAEQTALDYGLAWAARSRPGEIEAPPIRTCSALTGQGIREAWTAMVEQWEVLRAGGEMAVRRADQRRKWMWVEMAEDLVDLLRNDANVKAQIPQIERLVVDGEILPMTAAHRLIEVFLGRKAHT